MSTPKSTQPVEIDVETLALTIQLVKEEIDAIQDHLRRLIEVKDSIDRAILGLKSIVEMKSETPSLLFLDPSFNVAVSVMPIDKEKALVSLGFNIYVKLPSDQAIKILEERRVKVEKAIEETSRTLSQLVSLHERYYATLQQILASAQTERRT